MAVYTAYDGREIAYLHEEAVRADDLALGRLAVVHSTGLVPPAGAGEAQRAEGHLR